MRISEEEKLKTRNKIIESAARGFRDKGYSGLGIDGLASRASLTSGAFYGHFKSKDDAFRAVTIKGLEDYISALRQFQEKYKDKWLDQFLDYYLGEEHYKDIESGCIIPGLSNDIVRRDEKTKIVYEDKVNEISSIIANGLDSKDKNHAFAIMALISGGVLMARAVGSDVAAKNILKSVYNTIHEIIK